MCEEETKWLFCSYLSVKETYRIHNFHPFHLIWVSITPPQVSLYWTRSGWWIILYIHYLCIENLICWYIAWFVSLLMNGWKKFTIVNYYNTCTFWLFYWSGHGNNYITLILKIYYDNYDYRWFIASIRNKEH